MIGMTLREFLVLLVAGAISATVIHYVAGYRFLTGLDGFLGKWITGWLGAWLGSPVFGHWFQAAKVENIYLVPALLGAFVGSFATTAIWKAAAKAFALHAEYAPSTATSPIQKAA